MALAATSVFSAMLASIHADDDYWQIEDRMRATHWHLWKTPDGDWVRFPKFFELAVPANIMERYILMRHANDETQGEKMFRDLYHTVVPPHEIPCYRVLAETTTNATLKGRDIVPRYMRDLPAPMQYDERTTALSRWMCETFGVRPMIMDHLMFSLGGTYAADYRIAERAADPNAPDLRSDQILLWRRFLDRP